MSTYPQAPGGVTPEGNGPPAEAVEAASPPVEPTPAAPDSAPAPEGPPSLPVENSPAPTASEPAKDQPIAAETAAVVPTAPPVAAPTSVEPAAFTADVRQEGGEPEVRPAPIKNVLAGDAGEEETEEVVGQDVPEKED